MVRFQGRGQTVLPWPRTLVIRTDVRRCVKERSVSGRPCCCYLWTSGVCPRPSWSSSPRPTRSLWLRILGPAARRRDWIRRGSSFPAGRKTFCSGNLPEMSAQGGSSRWRHRTQSGVKFYRNSTLTFLTIHRTGAELLVPAKCQSSEVRGQD